MRATTSLALPGANGITAMIVLEGKACARAPCGVARKSSVQASAQAQPPSGRNTAEAVIIGLLRFSFIARVMTRSCESESMSSSNCTALSPLIPAQAGIQGDLHGLSLCGPWVPACAGTSGSFPPEADASLEHEVERETIVEGDGRMLDAARRRLGVAAHRIEPVADHSGGESVARMRHRGQHLPAIERGVVGFDRAVGGEQLAVLVFAAGDNDVIVVDAPAHGAAAGRHLVARAP